MRTNQTTLILRLLLILASVILPPPLRAQVGHEWQRLPDVPFDPEPYNPPICYRDQTIYFVRGTTQTLAWGTHDGRQWQCIETGLPAKFSVPFVFQDRLWLPAGVLSASEGTSTTQGALYSCTEPTHWMQESLVPETNTLSLVFPVGSTLVLYANENVYTSADGKAWIYQSAGASYWHIPYVFAGRLWDCDYDLIYSSTNWIIDYHHFTYKPSALSPQGQEFTMPVPCGDRLLLLQADYQGQPGGTWESHDGTQWAQVNIAPPFAPITSYQGAYGNGGLWELGDYCYEPTAVDLFDRGLWFSPEAIPQLQWQPGFCNFGDVMLSAPPPVQSVQLYNSTAQTVHFGSADFVGADATRFGFAQPPDLSPLPAHTTRTLQLKFDPSATGYQWATLRLMTDLASETTRTFTLAGNGIADAPLARVEPVVLNFGSRPPGSGPSAPQELILYNDGTQSLAVGTWFDSADDVMKADYDITLPANLSLAPFTSCTIQVRFNPRQHFGLRNATLHISGCAVALTARSGPPGRLQGLDWQQFAVNLEALGRHQLSVARFQQQYYTVVHGLIWRSSNLADWTASGTPTPFPTYLPDGTYDPRLVVFQNRLWAFKQGAWATEDGLNWTTMTLPAALASVDMPVLVEFNGRLWVLGGRRNFVETRDVWSTPDGVRWDGPLAGPMSESGERSAAGAIGTQMVWAAGGVVWCTADGVQWTSQLNKTANLPAMAVHNGALWMTGYFRDLWRTFDGVIWECVADATLLPDCRYRTLFSAGGDLYFLGGGAEDYGVIYYPNGIPTYEVWVSTPSANAVGAWACYQ